jgi:hypothetical protein
MWGQHNFFRETRLQRFTWRSDQGPGSPNPWPRLLHAVSCESLGLRACAVFDVVC